MPANEDKVSFGGDESVPKLSYSDDCINHHKYTIKLFTLNG